jgi:hypothetical protein
LYTDAVIDSFSKFGVCLQEITTKINGYGQNPSQGRLYVDDEEATKAFDIDTGEAADRLMKIFRPGKATSSRRAQRLITVNAALTNWRWLLNLFTRTATY